MATTDRRSEPGLDLYRALVVLMMFVVHTRRLQPPSAGPLERGLAFFMWAEPFIAASFLFIAGVALALAAEKAGFLAKALRRVPVLYALAVLLFVPQYGVDLPDLLASPGILSAIALALALVAGALASPAPNATLCALGLVVLGVTAFLDRSGATVSGLNAGPGGAFPLIAFTALGALVTRAERRTGARAFGFGLALAVPLFVAALALGGSWVTERVSFYRAHSGQLALLSLGTDAPRAAMRFWNHSAVGAVGLAAPLLGSLALALWAGRKLAGSRALAPFLVLGRHALAVYVVHLGLLGVLDLAGLAPRSPVATWGTVAAIAVTCWCVAWVLELRTASARRGTLRADTPAGGTGGGRSPRPQT